MPAVEMKVEQVMMDSVLGAPVLLLREVDGPRALPIAIGQVEAVAIAAHLEGVQVSRPMTHDLMRDLVARLGASVLRITVTDLRDGVFFAEVVVDGGAGEVCVDARPSDAVALAIRAGVPILAEESVLRAGSLDQPAETGGERCEGAPRDSAPRPITGEEVEDAGAEALLESLDDEDFGKWKM